MPTPIRPFAWGAPLLLALVLAPALAGQTPVDCPATETVRSCMDLLRGVKRSDVTLNAKTAKKPVGEAEAQDVMPSVDDFLPRLAAAALVPGLDEGVSAARLAVNIPLVTEYTGYLPAVVRLGAELHRPEVLKAMLDSVPESRRPAVQRRLEGGLDELSDLELTVGINAESRWLGRRYDPHRRELETVLAPDTPLPGIVGDLSMFLLGQVGTTAEARCKPENDLGAMPLDCVSGVARLQLNSLMRSVVGEEQAYVQGFEAWGKRSGWVHVPDLLNNQPQLSLHAGWRTREDAVGPETFSVRMRYEAGLANLNAVRRYCQRRGRYTDGRLDQTCFRNFVMGVVNQRLLRLGVRGFVQGEAVRDRSFRAPFVEADTAGRYSLPSAWRLRLTGGVGGFLPTASETQGSRAELGVELEWADKDDPARPARRANASLSVIQRLSDNFSLLSGLVWSDRGEFKEDDVHKVRLNLGVRYKLLPGTSR